MTGTIRLEVPDTPEWRHALWDGVVTKTPAPDAGADELDKFDRDSMVSWVMRLLEGKRLYLAEGFTPESRANSPWGRRYTALTARGIKPEGEASAGFENTEDLTIAYAEQLKNFCKDARMVIFRAFPKVERDDETGLFYIYSRLDCE